MDQRTQWRLVRILISTLYLMAGWLLFTGTIAPFSLILGAVFSLAIALLTYGLLIEEHEAARRLLIPRLHLLLVYLLLILIKVYAASFRIAVRVITGRIDPRIVHFRTRLRSDLARVALANSITLTPGTVTLDLDEDHLVVHWLEARTRHSRYAFRLIASPFERWLDRIWL